MQAEDFAANERSARSSILRYGVLIAVATLLLNVLQSMATFEPRAIVSMTIWVIALSINFALMFWWAGTEGFKRRPYLDLAFTIPVILWMHLILSVVIAQVVARGWSPVATTTSNYVIGVAFASLFFPANFRCYLIWSGFFSAVFVTSILDLSSPGGIEREYAWGTYIPIVALSLYYAWSLDRKGRRNFDLTQELLGEKSNTEEMLYSILPEEVADRMRAGEAIADAFSDATVVFVDLVGSSALARNLSPMHFIRTLNDVFTIADHATAQFGIERVKTIGDAYLAVAGARGGGSPTDAIAFAQHVIEEVNTLARDRALDLGVRVGIHTGPVIGGVIGHRRSTYDYWGDTMNVAARVESVAEPGHITVTKQTYFATRGSVDFLPPRMVTLKGIGDMQVFDVAPIERP